MSEPDYDFRQYDEPEPNELPVRVFRNDRFRALYFPNLRCLQFLKVVSEAQAGETQRATADHYDLDPDSITVKLKKIPRG